jgi:hypothetical protein
MTSRNLTPLDELQQRLEVVRTRVRGVASRHHTGFYVFGPPGTGKTHTVKETLHECGQPYAYHAGHLTPLGLFDLLDAQHNRVIVLDDVAAMLESSVALQLLLAALGNQPDDTETRIVKYKRQNRDATVRFTGGLILISNLALHPAALLEALKSRVHYLQHDPTDEQLAALMRYIASQGCPRHGLSPAQCAEVVEFVIAESQKRGGRLDIRVLVDKAFPDFAQHRERSTRVHWKDLVRTTLEEQVNELLYTPPRPARRVERLQNEQRILREIIAAYETTAERLMAWRDQTGKSDRAYYRRRREISDRQ